jgi:glycosyltransferase involved in cell wall biosynthesis
MARQSQPVISVVIVTHNYGRYLARALESVFRCHNPTGAPLQVIVTDDASTDNTWAVLAGYRRRYPDNLEIVSFRMPAGVGAARNAALDRCRGRIVALLDADDEFLPDKLIHAYAAFHAGGVDLLTSDFYRQSEDGRRALKNRHNGHPWFWPPSTWVFRMGLLRFNPHFWTAEDLDWMERRWMSVRRRHLECPLTVQHVHGSQHHHRWDGSIPARQLGSWISGHSPAIDTLAPRAWACRECGNQYLLPTRCCERPALPRPLLFYVAALSPHYRSQTEFSVVMPTRNGLPATQRAVASLLARLSPADRRAVEFVFVDGASTDGTLAYFRALAQSWPVKLILTHPAEPFNYSRACNRGARAAVGQSLLFLNNDIELQGEAPWAALRAALADPRVGVVGAAPVRGLAPPEPAWEPGAPPYRRVNRPLTGEFWGMRREVYWELGGMDEAFAGYGCDELDFQFRALEAQYHLAQVRVAVQHAGQRTFAPRYGPAALRAMEQDNYRLFTR